MLMKMQEIVGFSGQESRRNASNLGHAIILQKTNSLHHSLTCKAIMLMKRLGIMTGTEHPFFGLVNLRLREGN